MVLRSPRLIPRAVVALLAIAVALYAVAPAASGAVQAAERLQLRALGLLDSPDCGTGRSRSVGHSLPGQPVSSHTGCDCCLTGCGWAAPAGPMTDSSELSWPRLVMVPGIGGAVGTDHLRTFLEERTGSPRSPPGDGLMA